MTRIALRVQPGAKRVGLLGRMPGGGWKVAVVAPALEGRANAAVVELMSEWLGVPRRHITLARGESSRNKVVEVEGLSEAEAEARLEAALAARRKDEGETRGE